MAKWTYENTRAGYRNLWRRIEIKPTDAKAVERFAQLIIKNEVRYREVEATTGVPWFFIGALHMRESSCNFAGALHNGQKIIGTGRKTTLVPAGRGPFRTWAESADDALRLKGLHKIKDWSIERMGYEAERFNGLGYVGKGVNSAYLWAGSNLEQPGKYIADHQWSSTAEDSQIGVMTVLKRLSELRVDIDARINDAPPLPDVVPPPMTNDKPANPPKPMVKSKTFWATIVSAASSVAGFMTDWRVLALIVVLIALAYIVWERNGKPDIRGWFK